MAFHARLRETIFAKEGILLTFKRFMKGPI